MYVKKQFAKLIAITMAAMLLFAPQAVLAAGNGPNTNSNERVKNEMFTDYESLVSALEKADGQSELLEVEVFGQSVKGRNLHLVKFGNNPDNPTVLYITQKHGTEALPTESVLRLIQKLSTDSKEVRELSDKVNLLIVPRLNPDGAEGDVDWDTSNLVDPNGPTRNNANGIDLNRTHNSLSQPETRALHENVLQQYDIDFAIDFHTQSANRAVGDDELVSASMLYPTNTQVNEDVLHQSKQIGSVIFDALKDKGHATLAKYENGDTVTSNARNHLPVNYGIPTLLVELRGLTNAVNKESILGQKSNGYLIEQGFTSMEAVLQAVADRLIHDADISFWDTLEEQYTLSLEDLSPADRNVQLSGPQMNANQAVKIERFTSNEDLAAQLERADRQSDLIEVEVFGQSVQGRDLHLVKFGSNPENPTVLYITQKHGNEALPTESALRFVQHLSNNSQEVRQLSEQVNLLLVPRLNPDGAVGDVNWDTSNLLDPDGPTRNNANGIDLNRTHNSLSQPETRALHENILQVYDIDFAIDFHTQTADRAVGDNELVSGAILHPTHPDVSEEVLHQSKQIGSVLYHALEHKGYTNIAQYDSSGTATSNARNHLPLNYGVPTLLVEMRGFTNSPYHTSISGQKGNGNQIQQGVIAMQSVLQAAADRSIYEADVSFWDTLEVQYKIY
ncbi:hypothetical protein MM300_20585 [Evansella sp. LMS18]|uniref:M14 family zinc carboxypeptidase n=1 Tax=Evansella sp. LMS18 TaxID=2924033 RepID=UPI0020D1C739|nr:M14 family zinc carboxypeptidase [Evansella sp. LMS18]UTR10245.1 hypothetical protein MM300_20585 [Evansella sp. LMS18]